jgi:molecular chaperone HscA
MAAGMAKLEIAFSVDADGLLGVHAKEITTGKEQVVSVKPSYGLDDETVEKMLLDALEHGEEDLESRRLAENRVEGHRILTATSKAIAADRALLVEGEEERIRQVIGALDEAVRGSDAGKIHALIEELDRASKEFATRRMNRAIAMAIEGRNVEDVERVI